MNKHQRAQFNRFDSKMAQKSRINLNKINRDKEVSRYKFHTAEWYEVSDKTSRLFRYPSEVDELRIERCGKLIGIVVDGKIFLEREYRNLINFVQQAYERWSAKKEGPFVRECWIGLGVIRPVEELIAI